MLTALLPALLVAACGGASPQSTLRSIAYGDPAKAYLGMTKSDVIACAGTPHSTYKGDAASETLTYHYSGAGPVPGEAPKADDKKKPGIFSNDKTKEDKSWECTASFVFENDRLVRVTFAHKDVVSPYAYQSGKSAEEREKNEQRGPQPPKTCSFSLPRCPR